MKDVEYFQFWMPPKTARSKPWLTRYKMDMETARERFGPDVQPYLQSREVRRHDETPEERQRSVATFRTGPPPGGAHIWGGSPTATGRPRKVNAPDDPPPGITEAN